ncbi:hypothetical protein K466DRAFT_583101 [Polyporus arcularius HHB13444]|uniref:Uncharacterized protein n=1 Tax=Polyporus arcularius HHB13444 TaxID=1314778 RepID=A0A5C3PYC1_9APHY|nr:hypothetical protein K466DRAFT_583101 [Polyporus arcularius HHB13444]
MIVPTDEASSQAGDDDNAGEDDEEESADELDLISDPQVPPVPEEYKTWFVPPADQANPDDAEMFREFEEAEKKMRERYGVEGDDEDEAALDPGPDVESEPPLEEDEKEEDQEEAPSPPSPKPISRRRTSRPPPKTPGDDLSEDEFATWDFDETPVPPDRPVPPPVDDDIIDLTESPTPSPPRSILLRRGRSRSRPPQSQNRARSKSKPPVHVEKRVNTPEIEQCPANEPVLQLFTPPRSSSAPESIPVPTIHDHEPALSPPPPAETPSPKFPKPRARYTPRPRTPSDDDEEEIPLPPPLLNIPLKVGPPRGVKKQTSFKTKGLKPEVVITLPPKKLRSKTRSARPASPEPPSSPSPQASKNKKSKGKEKEVPETHLKVTSGPQTSRRRRSQSQPRISTRESDSPQPPPPTRGTKRRRVSSLSSLSDSSPARPVTPDPVSVPLSAVRNKRLTRSGSSRSGYSSDIPPPTSSPVLSDAEDDNEGPRRTGRSHARPASVAPHMPPYPYPPPMFAHYTPRHDHHSSASAHRYQPDERHATPFSTPAPASLQDPQAQLMFAHAWHSLSYLVASGAISAPPPPGGGYPSGLPFPPAPWPPYTPSHQRHRTHPFDTPSFASEAGPSRSSTYSTPTHHPHPYPYSYDPMFSNSTLPPSSPIRSSPATSSPTLRPASVPAGQRSRSRGRRVSFKLDENDRPIPPTPRTQGGFQDTSKRAGPSSTPKVKGKGKARAEPGPEPGPERREEQESSDDDDEPPPRPPRGRALRRASTPGPPSQREKSVPAGSTSKTSASSKGTTNKTPKSAKRKD